MNDQTPALLDAIDADPQEAPTELLPVLASAPPAPASAPEAPEAPAVIWAGTVAIYQAADGGFVMVARDQDGIETRKHVPGMLVKAVTGGGGGIAGSLFRRLAGE